MRARIVEVIEVESGGVRRYWTRDGESIGIGAAIGAEAEPSDAPTFAEHVMADASAKMLREIRRERGVPENAPGERIEPLTVREIIDQVPRKRIVPPFDPREPGVPGIRLSREERGTEPEVTT